MREKGARGEKRIREARIKKQRQFLMHASLGKLARKARLLVTQSPASPENCKKAAIETNWKQKTEGKAEAVQGLRKFKWDFYPVYMVMSHSHWMTLKYIINFTEKIMPALVHSVCLNSTKDRRQSANSTQENTECLRH